MEETHNEQLFVDANQLNNKSSGWGEIAWGAIILGVVVCFAYEILLNFLGGGLGLTSLNISKTKVFTLSIGAISWLAISSVVSMGVGGWFTGMLSNVVCKYKLCCYGIITWSLATILTAMIATTASSAIMGGIINILNLTEQPIYQSSMDMSNDSQLQQNFIVTKEQEENANKQIDNYANNMGKTSLIIFTAILLSGFASVIGAVYGGRRKKLPIVK
ncbi:MAG: hypothetical protein K2X04_12165 [Burkholderiales bacterium]|nr:hypothetical protein [Burkholderiales bacterium]